MVSNDRQDKLLMETCIKHLIQYAATIKISRGAQGDESIGRLRKIIGEMEAYWNLSDRKGRVEQFDKTLRRAVQTGRTNGVSEEQKIAAVNGLYRYASEMISAQGAEAADRIKEVQSVIRELADQESCIIAGRCADYILSREDVDVPGLVKIFVYADVPALIKRTMEVDKVDEKEAARRVKKINRERKEYYRYYTGGRWEDWTNYDLIINTSKFDLEQTAKLIKDYIKLKGIEL